MADASASHDGEDAQEPELKHFRLFDLPPELWIKIGKMAIDDSPAIKNYEIHCRRTIKSLAALAYTCRALRKELLPYYCETKISPVFSIFEEAGRIGRLGHWARRLDPSTRAMVTEAQVYTYRKDSLEELESLLSGIWLLKIKLVPLVRAGAFSGFRPFKVKFED
ncbi:hypothetical protein PRZ48_011766 [Zasmidium cellare]|uniref:F-box domain-containing protein n=1 Tax=Zasmidium cellare TaxID=395010 RepID=A0ABR0E7X5_ZASCE|nr:hypothetical protein PRZ48_011766 [Zasmidium cellare]